MCIRDSTYGKEGMGISPSDLRTLRTQAAEATTGPAKGKCTTTSIWLAYGPAFDPAIRVVKDQVGIWLDVWLSCDQIQVSRAWAKIKMKFLQAEKPWATVRGPIGSTIATLISIGWNPISPFLWIDAEGFKWKFNGGPRDDIMAELERQLSERISAQAAKHRCGTGLEKGPDLSIMRKHLDKLQREGEHRDAGTLANIGQ